MYEIEFSKEATDYLCKLDKSISERIVSSIGRIRIRPFAFVKKLVASDLFSFRTGDYRSILRINHGKLIIVVIEIGHRKNIYKNI